MIGALRVNSDVGSRHGDKPCCYKMNHQEFIISLIGQATGEQIKPIKGIVPLTVAGIYVVQFDEHVMVI